MQNLLHKILLKWGLRLFLAVFMLVVGSVFFVNTGVLEGSYQISQACEEGHPCWPKCSYQMEWCGTDYYACGGCLAKDFSCCQQDDPCAGNTSCGQCGNPPCCSVNNPSKPALQTPPNGAQELDANSVGFSWSGVNFGSGCPTRPAYILQTKLKQDPTCGVGAWANKYSGGATSTTQGGFAWGRTYCWRVVATNGARSTGSDVWQFTTNYEPVLTSITAISGLSCDADSSTVRWSGKTDLGNLESERKSAPNNPVRFQTTLTDTVPGDIRTVYMQIAPSPGDANVNSGYYYVRYDTSSNPSTPNTFWVKDGSGWKQVPAGSSLTTANLIVRTGGAYSTGNYLGTTLEVYWHLEFRDPYPSGKHKMFVFAEDKLGAQATSSGTKTTADSRRWNTIGVGNGSPDGFWGVDMLGPGGTVDFVIDPLLPTRGDIYYSVRDPHSQLRTIFNRQFQRVLSDGDPAGTPWEYYVGIEGTSTETWPPQSVSGEYWPGPSSIDTFDDVFNEVYGGTYSFRVLGEDNACNIGDPKAITEVQAPWLRTKYGDVYSNSYIDVTIPDLPLEDGYLATFLVSYMSEESKVIGAVSRQNYELSLYNDYNFSKDFISLLKRRVSSKGLGTTKVADRPDWWNGIQSGSGSIYNISGATSDADFVIAEGAVCTRPTIIFVDGNLIMNADFLNDSINSACMFVVDGNLILNSSEYVPGAVAGDGSWTGPVDRFEAAFVVSGTVYTTQNFLDSGQKFAPPSNKLEVQGFVITKAAQFSRNLGNEGNSVIPAEEFEYDPRHLVLLAEFLGVRKKRVYECGVVDVPECAGLNE